MQRVASNILSIIFFAAKLSACATQSKKPILEIQTLINYANSGNTEAQFKLGSAYDSGQSVTRNGNEALKWYLKAAEAGNAEAQNSVGSGFQAEKHIYVLMSGMKKQKNKTTHWQLIISVTFMI